MCFATLGVYENEGDRLIFCNYLSVNPMHSQTLILLLLIFSQTSVSHSVHRGGVSQHALGQTPPKQTPPNARADTPHPQTDTPTPRQTPPARQLPLVDTSWEDTPQAHTPLGRHPLDRHPSCPVHALIHEPPAQGMLGYTPSPYFPCGHCCGRYASYWDAFLLTVEFHVFFPSFSGSQ